jgi:hypothetical protein
VVRPVISLLGWLRYPTLWFDVRDKDRMSAPKVGNY